MRISDWSSDVCSSDLDHWFEPQAKLGKSVPLLGPEPGKGDTSGAGSNDMADGFERPKGRMLLFWGCGAKPGPGQPVVIDFSKLAAGQMPPNLFTSTIPRIREITAANSAAYAGRSEEHTSELQSLMRITYAFFCLKKKQYKKLRQHKTCN